MGAADLAVWSGPSARFSYRPGAGPGAVHADELSRESREPVDQQPHRSRHQHARLQGDHRSSERAARNRREPVAPNQFSLRSSTPQNGVEVERKWRRPDYAPPENGLVQLQTKR